MDPAGVLPEEIFLRILSFLPPSSLCNCARVCKDWYALAGEDYPWFIFLFFIFYLFLVFLLFV